MSDKTVRQKISKKQQREKELKRKALGRRKQAAYVARMKAQGKSLIRFWVTAEERVILERVRAALPKWVEMERAEKGTKESSSKNTKGQH